MTDINDINIYLKTKLKNEVSIFKLRGFTDYDKIFSFIHDTLGEEFIPIMNEHHDQNHMNFYQPPSLYHVYIWGVIARLIQADIENLKGSHPHEEVFYNCLISSFSKHPEFFNLFKILSHGYVKDNDLRNVQLHIRNHFPVTARIDSVNDMVIHYRAALENRAALERVVIHEKGSPSNKRNFFQDVLNYLDK